MSACLFQFFLLNFIGFIKFPQSSQNFNIVLWYTILFYVLKIVVITCIVLFYRETPFKEGGLCNSLVSLFLRMSTHNSWTNGPIYTLFVCVCVLRLNFNMLFRCTAPLYVFKIVSSFRVQFFTGYRKNVIFYHLPHATITMR